jgi:restriction system protein
MGAVSSSRRPLSYFSLTSLPRTSDLLWPTLRALQELGGSGTVEEIAERVIALENFTAEQQAVMHSGGPQTEIEYRLAWARTYLKAADAVLNSERGVWVITETGRALKQSDMPLIVSRYHAERRRERTQDSDDPGIDAQVELLDGNWRDQLLGKLLSMQPAAFERLSQRLLREAGFINLRVTGKSGDGGIDGTGVYQVSLVSFPIYFQCKRWRGSVGASVVRDFRGALAGRGDRGLLISTGSYTADAKKEAAREGVAPIELIDGDRLCDLLKEHGLGVVTQIQTVEVVTVSQDFFEGV